MYYVAPVRTSHEPQLSGNGREDTGGKGDTIEMENETSGTGLTTTQKMGVRNESHAKEGARNCGERSKRVEVKAGIAEWVREERKQQSQQSNVVGGARSELERTT
jgi:hypothetical protein